MDKNDVKKLEGWEKEVYLWLEQDSSIMVKAATVTDDPVELTANDARNFAKLLNEAASKLDELNG